MRKRAIQTISPAVIAAHQRTRAPRALDEGHPAMTAGVAEYSCPAIVATHREQRRTEADAFNVVPRVRNGRRRDEYAGERAQQPQFVRESCWFDVVFNRSGHPSPSSVVPASM